ncbi:inner membrane protein YbjM [Lonsdalea quercina]|uniref:inner membrane protein YbjM n=1 Tax=Lonsdalea quercina TaxID=71657 RepID=UPI003975C1EF
MANNKGWIGIISCLVLFTLVFLSQKMMSFKVTTVQGSNGEPGMLLFLLPGIISSYLTGCDRMRYTLIGSLIAVPLCLWLLRSGHASCGSFWQDLAYVVVSVFWTLLGGLLVLFLRAVVRHFFHK